MHDTSVVVVVIVVVLVLLYTPIQCPSVIDVDGRTLMPWCRRNRHKEADFVRTRRKNC